MLNKLPGYQKLSWSKVVMDFQIPNCRSICVNHFLNVTICQTVLFLFFPTLCSMPKDLSACLTNCVGVFRETDSVTHKKGAGRPIVRTEEIGHTK
jgi:hypothetical protein